jgi:hypothetical protein
MNVSVREVMALVVMHDCACRMFRSEIKEAAD